MPAIHARLSGRLSRPGIGGKNPGRGVAGGRQNRLRCDVRWLLFGPLDIA